jgi:hypothetical protein
MQKKYSGETKACSKAWFGHLQVQEKKKKRKIAHIQKMGERESYKDKRGIHTKINKISTHLHILIRLHDLFVSQIQLLT